MSSCKPHFVENLVETEHDTPPLNGLQKLADHAIQAAEIHVGYEAREHGLRDSRGIRGLAVRILRDYTGNRYGWGDIAWAVYRRRKHNTAIAGAARWNKRKLRGRALATLDELIENSK